MRHLIVLLLFVLLFSCSKDSESTYAESIIGNWRLTSGEPLSSFDPCDFQGYLTFKSDHTILNADACTYTTSNGLWRITDNILTLSDDETGFPIDILIVSLSESQMQLKYQGVLEVYNKVTESQIQPIATCKYCKQATYDQNGVLKSSGTEAKYCGSELKQIESIPPVLVGGILTKWECHSK